MAWSFLPLFLALTHARLVAALLNPADKQDEIRFFIEDSRARAIVAEGTDVAVREASAGLGLPIWQPRVDSRGVVELPELPAAARANIGAPGPDDVALFTYTSGTTGTPQMRAAHPCKCALVSARYRHAL
jgi:acyl-CoA synthetase (AMP-forming)/AMP-acid ligase II